MKKIQYFFLAMIAAICCTSCNNEWEDEQFVQLASFKAVPNSDGVTSVYVRYKPGGVVTYNLPILLSGSTANTQDRTIHVTLDKDTLNTLNEERYGQRDKLYYQLLESQYYTTPESVEIPAGESVGVLPIDLTLGGAEGGNPIDMSDKWILPLSIMDDPSYNYQVNPRKHYRKALLNITPFNDYSGTYSGSNYLIYLDGQSAAFTKTQCKAYVHDDKTIFIYMGLRDGEYLDRKDYKLFIEFTDEEINPVKKKLRLYTDRQDQNKFEISKGKNDYGETVELQAYYMVDTEKDAAKPYLEHTYITLYLAYEFEDSTLSPGNPLKYKVEGTLSMQRDLNTLIPDEDQQIEWY